MAFGCTGPGRWRRGPAHTSDHARILLVDGLRQAALRQDWAAWQQAWQQAEAGPIAQLLAHVRAGGQATLDAVRRSPSAAL